MLCLLPLAWLVWRFMPAANMQPSQALKIPFFDSLQRELPSPARLDAIPRRKLLLVYSIWGLLVIAAARPEWLGTPTELPRRGRNIMLAVDISGSMQTPDMVWHGKRLTRLDGVKIVAGDFIKRRTSDRLGLILFGSQAYLQTPLTFDRHTVLAMLNDATIGLAGRGTALGDAVALAIKRMPKSNSNDRVLILLTDGLNTAGVLAPLIAAELAAKEALKIYTIGIGDNRTEINNVLDLGNLGVQTETELDIPTLMKMAEITGGTFFRARELSDLQDIYEQIDQLEPVATDNAVLRPIQPLYMWPLGLALLLTGIIAVSHIGRFSFNKNQNVATS